MKGKSLEKYPKDAVPVARSVYAGLREKQKNIRERLGRSLTLTEKILFSHWEEGKSGIPERGKTTGHLWPDRVAMQDATAQMAILQFMSAGIPRVAVPTTVHCDHLIRALSGSAKDLDRATRENKE